VLAACPPCSQGLGKTMQCCAFLAGLLGSNLATRALVIAPKTLLLHWEKELGVCGLSARTYPFYGDSASERANSLRAATGPRGGVLLTTYGMILHNAPQLLAPAQSPYRGFSKGRGGDDDDVDDGAEFAWDFIILDEGHKVGTHGCGITARLNSPCHIEIRCSAPQRNQCISEIRIPGVCT
jgi:SNF2 family DNA or RNA helicase